MAKTTKSKSKLTLRAVLNSGAALLNAVSRIAVGLVVTPIMIAILGREMNGVWKSIQVMFNNIGAIDGRSAQALKWVIANKQSDEITDEEKQKECGKALAVWFMFLPILIAIGLVMMYYAPYLTKCF